jgi:hypothetical protein
MIANFISLKIVKTTILLSVVNLKPVNFKNKTLNLPIRGDV